MEVLKHFIPDWQNRNIIITLMGQNPAFDTAILLLKNRIINMPRPYETNGQKENAIVHLHYNHDRSHWFITERDSSEEQLQAYGYACINGDLLFAEFGYISIEELIRSGVELDLNWKPRKMADARNYLHSILKEVA